MYDLFYSTKETAATVKNQGNALLNEGRIDDAERMYRKAIALDPRYMPAHYNLGNALRIQRRFDEALTAYEAALGLAPDDFEIYMNKGVTLIELGRAAEALQAFGRAHELMPSAAEPLVNMGLACERMGRAADPASPEGQRNFHAAVEYYGKALAVNPGLAVAHNNLGFALLSQGKPDAAMESLQRALEINPDFSDAHNNLGNALQSQGRIEEAVSSFRQALALNPDSGDAHYNLGNAYKELKRFEEAEACYRKALALHPGFVKALNSLGGLLMEHGRAEEALACFRQAVALEPDNAAASHMIASMTGAASEAAPSQYVAELFDGFASNFEESLVESLNYEIPKKLVSLISDFSGPASGVWDILDLGCGTGLVGPEIAPYARQLVGVDLSSGMLAKAREKNLYHRLERAELLEMMKDETTSSYDVIVAADVFVYIGRLDAVMGEMRRLLRPGGMLAFSVEAAEALSSGEPGAVDYRLNRTGRYAHSAGYLERMAHEHGFGKRSLSPTNLRLEKGVPVQGWVVLLENAGG